jgi:hypothetical protein
MTKRNLFVAVVLTLVAAALALWMAARPSAPLIQEAPREFVPADTAADAPAGSTEPASAPDAAPAATTGAFAGQSELDRAPELPAAGSPQETPAVPELDALPTPSGQPVGEELIRVPSAPVAPADVRPEIELEPELQTTPGSAGELVDAATPGQGDTSTR